MQHTAEKLVNAANKSSGFTTDGSRNELPIIHRGDNLLVDARLLHRRLQVETRFNDWIIRRFEEYGFEEGADFYSNLSKSTGGRKATDYHVTIDVAKELAMVERNDIGRSIRKYFIEAEKKTRTSVLLAETSGTFAGLIPMMHGGHKTYSYTDVLRRLGFSTRSGSAGKRKERFGAHFYKLFGRNFVTDAFAKHLAEEKKLIDARLSLQLELWSCYL